MLTNRIAPPMLEAARGVKGTMNDEGRIPEPIHGIAALVPVQSVEPRAFCWRTRRGIIAVIGLRGIPNVMGGIETHCETLYPKIGALLKGSYSFTVLARDAYVPRGGLFKGIRVIPLYTVRNKYLEAAVHSFISVLYARFFLGAEIVHIHAIGPSLAAPLASMVGMKVVVTHHGEDWRRNKWSGIARVALKLGERAAMRTAERVIVISRSLKDSLTRRYSEANGKITYIPNGAPMKAARAADPSVIQELGLDGKPYVLAVGRLVPEKGFQDLITAFEASGVDMRLVICGGADHGDAFTDKLMSRASPNVVFTGRLPREKVIALYHGASLFVLPSYHEGLPLVALEAIASGSPIVVSDIDGNRDLDLPEKNYFGAGDIAAIAKILRSDHTAFRVDAERVLKVFDWDDIAEQTARVFRDIGD